MVKYLEGTSKSPQDAATGEGSSQSSQDAASGGLNPPESPEDPLANPGDGTATSKRPAGDTGDSEPPPKKWPSAAAGSAKDLEQFELEPQSVTNALNKFLGNSSQSSEGEVPNSYFVAGTVVDNKLKQKIWDKQYVDLGSLVPKLDRYGSGAVNFAFSQGNTSHLQFTPNKPPQPSNIYEWINWFGVFAAIYTRRYSAQAPSLFTYIQRVMSLSRSHPNSYVWRIYDERFRRLKQYSDALPWFLLDQHVLNDAKEISSQSKGTQGSQGKGNKGKSQVTSQDPKKPCFAYNRHSGCSRHANSCRYKHECTGCQGGHPVFKCTKVADPRSSASAPAPRR